VLTKGQSSYNKLQKEMNEAPKEYNAIKKIVENNENSIEKLAIIFNLKRLS
jgi:predicted patatin/cPLA2 family phospholipase